MPATIKDIREETGLSLATISKYLNGGNVLPENREKIERAVKKLDYHVNDMARSLVTRKSHVIGMTVPTLTSPFNGTLIQHIEPKLSEEGYGLIICDCVEDEQKERQNIRFLLQKKVDGLIVIPVSREPAFLQEAISAGVPVVTLDRMFDPIDSVTIDNRKAAKEAVELLLHAGHREIGIIYCGDIFTGVERYQGYCSTLRQAGIAVRDEYVRNVKTTVDDGLRAMRELLTQPSRPTAVFFTNYDINLGALLAIREEGLSYPGDVSLVGFDDLVLPRLFSPSLCVMVQPMEEMGRTAGSMILKKIRGQDDRKVRHIILNAQMREGESVVSAMTQGR